MWALVGLRGGYCRDRVAEFSFVYVVVFEVKRDTRGAGENAINAGHAINSGPYKNSQK